MEQCTVKSFDHSVHTYISVLLFAMVRFLDLAMIYSYDPGTNVHSCAVSLLREDRP